VTVGSITRGGGEPAQPGKAAASQRSDGTIIGRSGIGDLLVELVQAVGCLLRGGMGGGHRGEVLGVQPRLTVERGRGRGVRLLRIVELPRLNGIGCREPGIRCDDVADGERAEADERHETCRGDEPGHTAGAAEESQERHRRPPSSDRPGGASRRLRQPSAPAMAARIVETPPAKFMAAKACPSATTS
jgi:hypothetical protein